MTVENKHKWLEKHLENITDLQLAMFGGRVPEHGTFNFEIWYKMNQVRGEFKHQLEELGLKANNLCLPFGEPK